jgi:hypothetical protein
MDLLEGMKLLESITETLRKGSEHYETQVDVQMIPGGAEAIGIMAARYSIDPAIIRLGVQMGVYLHIRVEENRRLANLYGDIK